MRPYRLILLGASTLLASFGLIACSKGDAAPSAAAARSAEVPTRGRVTVAIPVAGMTCAACPVAVRTALKKIDGVESADASREKKEAVVVFDAGKAKPEQFVEAINKLGYRAGVVVKR